MFLAVFPAENELFGQNHDLNRFSTTEKRAESESGIRFTKNEVKKYDFPNFSPHLPYKSLSKLDETFTESGRNDTERNLRT